MRSKDILKQAISNFDGTVIVVSHDRDFMDGIVDKVYEFRDHKVKEHLGGIYDFLRNKNLINLRDIERKDTVIKKSDNKTDTSNKQKYLEKKEYDRTLRKLQRLAEESEKDNEKMENRVKETE